MIRKLEYPFMPDRISRLRLGDRVLISGLVFTGRDRLHQHLQQGGCAPVDLKFGAIYHCGPVMVRQRQAWAVRAAGPTTSIREEPFMAEIIRRFKITVIIGKGGMGDRTRAACARYGCVYLHAVGGAAQVLADKVARVAGVHFLKRFGPAEALWELMLKDFPAIVTMDARGCSLHAEILLRAKRRMHSVGGNT